MTCLVVGMPPEASRDPPAERRTAAADALVDSRRAEQRGHRERHSPDRRPRS